MGETTNGHRIKAQLRELQSERDLLVAAFQDGLAAFPDEEKPAPEAVGVQLLRVEREIAALQVLQDMLNLRISVYLPGQDRHISLAQAIAEVGGYERAMKRYREIATGATETKLFGYRSDVRKDDEIRKEPQISAARARELVRELNATISEYREAILLGNGRPVELPGGD
jgi:hypothetical protein